MSGKRIRLGAIAKRVLSFALVFGIVFGAIAIAEHWLITWQDSQTEVEDLHNTVKDISDNLFERGHWDLASYRQWDDSERSDFVVISGAGQLVDLYDPSGDYDYLTNLIRSAAPVDKYISRRPAYVTTDFGEHWLLQNKPVSGGNVVGGIYADDLIGLSDPETLIARELAKYGSTMRSAEDVKAKAIRNYMSGVMLVSDSGQILVSSGGVVPLKVQFQLGDELLDGRIHNFWLHGENYNLLASRTTAPSAIIIAYDVMDTAEADTNLKYSLLLALGAWILALFGYAAFAIRDKLREGRLESSLEISSRQLIAQGENAPVEFKSTLRRNLHTDREDAKIEFAVLKTIAAFLNTDGGTLLIGVSDDGNIMGLAADGFSSADKALLHLTNLIRSRVGSRLAVNVRMRVEGMDNGLDILRVDCKRSAFPAFVGEGREQHFFVRTGPATEELSLSEAHSYIKTRFDETG